MGQRGRGARPRHTQGVGWQQITPCVQRQVDQIEAEAYAERNQMGFYEVSPLVNFNITESFQELSRMALKRNGMERLWWSNKVLSLHELCCHSIVARTNVYG